MVQRQALARVLLPDPRLLLFDEPFTGLDRDGVDLLRVELQRARQHQRIILLVTHEVEALGDLPARLLVLRRGQLIAEPTAALPAQQLLEIYRPICSVAAKEPHAGA
jgi:ABC-type multidrug transport system ATPase subunit